MSQDKGLQSHPRLMSCLLIYLINRKNCVYCAVKRI